MVKEYISDKIGQEYREWINSAIILITAPTGTGKSHFILYELLKRAIESKDNTEKILYLVNRTILKEQLKRELYSEVELEMQRIYGFRMPHIDNYINIMTYQEIEKAIKNNNMWKLNEIRSYGIAVFDECHYFYNDSNFNTYTELSYDFLRKTFDRKIQIFMSATMKNMKDNIIKHKPFFWDYEAPYGKTNLLYIFRTEKNNGVSSNQYLRQYSAEKSYDNVKLVVFDSLEQLRYDIIETSSCAGEKWLIFTDSIENGKKFARNLTSDKKSNMSLRKEDVVFIDADFRNSPDAYGSVEQIVKNNYVDEKVVISTAVMDNGISIHDEELRNLVLLADTEESFIQMLGRKRADNQVLKVYVCRRNKSYFKKRLQHIEEILEFYNRHESEWEELSNWIYYGNVRRIYPYTATENSYLYPQYWNQQRILRDILEKTSSYHSASKLCYSVKGILAVNRFALQRCYRLRCFYYDMIHALEQDEDAFVKKQAEWLDMDMDLVEEYIAVSAEDIFNNNRNLLDEKIKENLGKNLTMDDNQKFKKEAKELFIRFCEEGRKTGDPQAELDKKDFEKATRTISEQRFNRCMGWANLPYRMTKPDRSTFLIEEVTEND